MAGWLLLFAVEFIMKSLCFLNEWFLNWLGLQIGNFLFNQLGDSVLGQINPGGADAQDPSHLRNGPVFDDVKIEYLELFCIDGPFDPIDSGFRQVRPPLLLPDRLQSQPRRIGHAFDGGSSGRCSRFSFRVFDSPLSLAQLIGDSPTGQTQQPTLE